MEINNLIKKNIRKKTALVMFVILVIFSSICFIGLSTGYFMSFFAGVPELTDVTQAQELYDKGIKYVSVSAEELYYTDYIVETITTRNGIETGRRNTSSFWVIDEDEKIFFVELPISYYNDTEAAYENVTFKGTLKRESKDIDILTWAAEVIAEDYGAEPAQVREMLIGNLYIDATSTGRSEFLRTMIFAPALVVSLLIFIWFLIRFINPRMHKIYKTMDSYGNVEEVEAIIQNEMNDLENCCIANTKLDYVLKTYTICTSNKLGIYPTKDLAWAYWSEIKTNGIVTGRFVKLKFIGKKAETDIRVNSQAESFEILQKLSQALPIIVGYDAKTYKLYKRDSDEFMELWQRAKDEFNNRGKNE